MELNEKQRGVGKRVLAGLVLTIAGLGAGILFLPSSLTLESSMAERMAYSLRADILVIFWLMVCIGRLGNHRFKTPEDIDGSGLTTGTEKAKILQSVLQNTLEQSVLAVVVHLIWTVVMPVSWIPGVLAAAILFFIGRLLFIRGYTGGAPSRALGFALTYYPTIIMLLAAAVYELVRLAA